ncbi:MAG: dTMP kinase [Legionellales bacterium]|jgi:dTMP kinase
MGKFIVLEGIEGVGKTTNMEFICQYLRSKHLDILRTREPGGTPLAEKIRDIVLHAPESEALAIDAELLLMFAARAQHLEQIIKPALEQKRWVISDRFTDASYAYQGGGRCIANDRIAVLENWVQGDLRPDLVIILDAPVELALSRTKQRKVKDRIEQEQADFFKRVRDVYLQRAKQDPKRYCIVDASLPLQQVQIALEKILDTLLT